MAPVYINELAQMSKWLLHLLWGKLTGRMCPESIMLEFIHRKWVELKIDLYSVPWSLNVHIVGSK